jgi:uncharacterized membrane protein
MDPTPINEASVAKQAREALAELAGGSQVAEELAQNGVRGEPDPKRLELRPALFALSGDQSKGQLPAKKSPTALISAASSQYEQFEGPIPPPQLLFHYESICPGSADRMLKMAEQEAEYRRKTETTIVDAQIEHNNKQFAEARCGQICALAITLAAIAGGVYTAMNGHETAGSLIGVGGIGGVVTTFILGSTRRCPDEDRSAPNE